MVLYQLLKINGFERIVRLRGEPSIDFKCSDNEHIKVSG